MSKNAVLEARLKKLIKSRNRDSWSIPILFIAYAFSDIGIISVIALLLLIFMLLSILMTTIKIISVKIKINKNLINKKRNKK